MRIRLSSRHDYLAYLIWRWTHRRVGKPIRCLWDEWSADLHGSKLPNGWGLFDLHRVTRLEWCQDWMGAYGSEASVSDPVGPLNSRYAPRKQSTLVSRGMRGASCVLPRYDVSSPPTGTIFNPCPAAFSTFGFSRGEDGHPCSWRRTCPTSILLRIVPPHTSRRKSFSSHGLGFSARNLTLLAQHHRNLTRLVVGVVLHHVLACVV